MSISRHFCFLLLQRIGGRAHCDSLSLILNIKKNQKDRWQLHYSKNTTRNIFF